MSKTQDIKLKPKVEIPPLIPKMENLLKLEKSEFLEHYNNKNLCKRFNDQTQIH